MKKIWIFTLSLLLTLGITQSCKKTPKSAEELGDEEIGLMIKSDLLSEDVIEDITGWVDGMNTSSRPGSVELSSYQAASHPMPSCVTVNHHASGDTLYVDLIFDPNGCQMPNGHVYAGTVHIQKYLDVQSASYAVNVSFENFYVDNVHIEGSFTRTRTWTNANGHPESTVSFDLGLTWPNGDTASREGIRTREWTEGYQTPTRSDDVFLITGNWHVMQRNGDEYEISVLTPLRREMSCRWIVSGVMEIVFDGDRYELDFGNGTCDDEATLTLPNGQTRTVYLQ